MPSARRRLRSEQPPIPLARPWIGREEIAAITGVLRSGWLTTGPVVTEFERAFASAVGAPHAVATNSCTGALHAALLALGVGPGHEVVTSTFTFVATAHVCFYVGATPRLVDIDRETWNIDPRAVEAAINDRTRAILPVHFAGLPCDLDAILKIAERHRLAVVEDAAHALGARYHGRPVGSIGTATAFSFYATKNATTGEGGMLTTADPALAERIREFAYFGISQAAADRYAVGGSWAYQVRRLGYKYNMDSIQAALGLVQLRRLARANARRARLAASLRRALSDLEEVGFQAAVPETQHAHHLFPIVLDLRRLSIGRGEFVARLAERGVGASVHYVPLHLHPFYAERFGFRPGDFPVAEDVARRIVSLPLFPQMSPTEVRCVAATVRDLILRHRPSRTIGVREAGPQRTRAGRNRAEGVVE